MASSAERSVDPETTPESQRVAGGDGVAGNIARICEIWEDCRGRFGQGGDFLFGTFTAADIMFAPVVTRLQTYGVGLSPQCRAYTEAVRATPEMQEWTAGA